MSSSSFRAPPVAGARGHRTGGAAVAGGWHVYPEMAAGGLWATPSDLARSAGAVQRAWAGTPGAILPPGLAGELLRPQAPNARMGLGLELAGEGSSQRFGHDGDDEGFVAGSGQQGARPWGGGHGQLHQRVRRRGVPAGDEAVEAADAPPAARRDHHGVLHGRVLAQRRLDLAHLDPVPLDLHLEVVPAEDLDVAVGQVARSEEHTSELQSRVDIVCRLLLE